LVTIIDMVVGTKKYFIDCGPDNARFQTVCFEGYFGNAVPTRGLTTRDILSTEINTSDLRVYNYTKVTDDCNLSSAEDLITPFHDSSPSVLISNTAKNPF